MTKHILDRPRKAPKSWLGPAIRIEKGARPSLASLNLQRRRRAMTTKRRAAQFVRIDRGGQEQLD